MQNPGCLFLQHLNDKTGTILYKLQPQNSRLKGQA